MSIGKHRGWDLWRVPINQEFPHMNLIGKWWFVAEDRNNPETYIGHYKTLREAYEAIDAVVDMDEEHSKEVA